METRRVSYDKFADCYYTRLGNGRELWCDCPTTLDDVLCKLDDHEERRAETRAIQGAILLGAALLALAAVLGAIWNV